MDLTTSSGAAGRRPSSPSFSGCGGATALKQAVQAHWHRLVQEGCDRNEAAARALALAKSEVEASGASSGGSTSSGGDALQSSSPMEVEPPEASLSHSEADLAANKYGPLCLGLAGPFQSICIVGEPRPGKKLLVLDIDHTIYDPSDHGGSRGSVVRSNSCGLYDESITARCRPGLHEFLANVYLEYDIMVWSASDMLRILTLLQQLGMCGAGHSDYRVVAVLDIVSMSELSASASGAADASADANDRLASSGILTQSVVVPQGALPGQQIEVTSIVDGAPMIVTVPVGLSPGDAFNVTMPGAVSSLSEEHGLDASDIQLALQLSLGQRPSPFQEDNSCEVVAPMPKARRKGRRVKPLSLIWACAEFSHFYSEKNTVIVDDTIDVCSANPRNSIQCIRYFWQDHNSDTELKRLQQYLLKIAQGPEFPQTHERWRDSVS